MKIGAILESFRMEFTESIRTAARLGVDGMQIYANGERVHAGMTKAEKEEVRNILSGEGLELSALCGDFGCNMFYYPKQMRAEIEREKEVLYLAKELGCDIVTTHIGVVPSAEDDFYGAMTESCHELAEYADRIGGHFAVETGPEKAAVLKGFLGKLNSRGVAVNFDPANLVMCAGDDPVEGVATLKDYIVHTHAKDGVMLRKTDTRRLYIPEIAGLAPESWEECIREVPLGTGGVDFPNYLAALQRIGYTGYLTIEREVGEDPVGDIRLAVGFLKEQMRLGGIAHE